MTDKRFKWLMIATSLTIIVVASIGIYSYSISHRYQRISPRIVFDNWTGKSIDVIDDIEAE